jgi:isoleucyl-tRNA synthetase
MKYYLITIILLIATPVLAQEAWQEVDKERRAFVVTEIKYQETIQGIDSLYARKEAILAELVQADDKIKALKSEQTEVNDLITKLREAGVKTKAELEEEALLEATRLKAIEDARIAEEARLAAEAKAIEDARISAEQEAKRQAEQAAIDELNRLAQEEAARNTNWSDNEVIE